MKIDTELFYEDGLSDYRDEDAALVLCADSLPSYFDLPSPLPERITLHLSTEEEEDAYLVKFTKDEDLAVFDDGPGSVITRKHPTYPSLDRLLEQFLDNTAWLSISWEE